MTFSIAVDLVIILVTGFVAGICCRRIGVPLLLGYLIAGVVVGKGLLYVVRDETHQMEGLAEAGVLLLLFAIGLELSVEDLARLGRPLLLGGTTQMILAALPATLASAALGVSWRAALILGAAIALSSTVLVFRALAEQGQTASPAGRRAIAVLLFQDAALVPLLLLVPLLTGDDDGDGTGTRDYAMLVGKSVLLWGGVLLLRRAVRAWIVPLLVALRSPELVVLFGLAALGCLSLLTDVMGLSPQIGAFAAGLVCSGSRLTPQMDALLLPFREPFAMVFFVSLGMLLDPLLLRQHFHLLIPGLVGILLLKTCAAALALRLTGLGWRASWGMGMGLSQIGEFSFVLVLQGWNAGVLTQTHYQYVLFFALGSMVLTPVLLRLGLCCAVGRDVLEPTAAPPPAADAPKRAIVVGLGPVGRQVASRLEISGLDVCAVDLSPVNLHPIAQLGFRTVAGDATDPQVLARADVDHSELVVVCAPDDEINVRIVRAVRARNKQCVVLVRCHYLSATHRAEKAGANATVSEESEAFEALQRLLNEMEKQWRR